MYIDNESRKAKIGIVNVSVRGKGIRLRFTYPAKNRNEITPVSNTDGGWITALQIAQQINLDIENGCFDFTCQKYGSQQQSIKIVEKPLNLKDCWESYKELNRLKVAETTIKNKWSTFDRLVNQTKYLEISQATAFVNDLLTRYSPATLKTLFSNTLHPAINLAIKQKKLAQNPYVDVVLPTKPLRDIDCYEKDEIQKILDAFYNDRYCPKKSAFSHCFYAPYVEFQTLVGSRPEETIALEWDDIIVKNGRRYIRFNKGFSNGILLNQTKNKTIRLFPINDQLWRLLTKIPHNNGLIFPGRKGGYLTQRNFVKRVWKTIIEGLISDSELDRYLPPYNLRHSFITRLVREGIDIATIARLSGNSKEVILELYLKANQVVEIPEF